MPNTAIAEAKDAAQVSSIRRKARLAAWEDYAGFVVAKSAGLGALIFGGIEILDPNLLPHLPVNAETLIGGGLALLAGNKVVTLLAKITNAFKR